VGVNLCLSIVPYSHSSHSSHPPKIGSLATTCPVYPLQFSLIYIRTVVHGLEDPQLKSESVECGFTSAWLSMHAPQAHQACNEKGDSECKGR
jgi:hypothetical protein